jgi:hypothetical protein
MAPPITKGIKQHSIRIASSERQANKKPSMEYFKVLKMRLWMRLVIFFTGIGLI